MSEENSTASGYISSEATSQIDEVVIKGNLITLPFGSFLPEVNHTVAAVNNLETDFSHSKINNRKIAATTSGISAFGNSAIRGLFDPPSISSAVVTHVQCFGSSNGSINITITLGVGGDPINAYAWTGPSGYTNTTEDIAGLAPGTYNVTVTDINGGVATGSYIITQPAALTISSVSSNSPVCEGSALNLSSAAAGGTGVISYSWTGPNSFVSAVQNPVIASATPAAAGTYTLTVTDANLCTASASTAVTVKPMPDVTVTPGSTYIYSGSSTSIALSGTLAGTLYTWTATANTTA